MKREGNFEALVETIRSNLIAGYIIAVVGWRDSNHSKDTRRYKESGKVMFTHEPPTYFGINVGYVIYPKWVNHGNFYELRKNIGKRLHPVVLKIDNIRKLFKRCEDLLIVPAKKKQKLEEVFIASCSSVRAVSIPQLPRQVVPEVHVETAVVTEAIFAKEAEAMADTPARVDPQPEVMEVTKPDYSKFAKRFVEEANKDKDFLVGKRTLGEIRRECGLDHLSNTDLVKEGLIEPITREGLTKAGRYMASDKLLALYPEKAKAPREPQGITLMPGDPLYEVYALIQTESAVASKIDSIDAQMNMLHADRQKYEDQLGRIEKAKDNLASLKALVSEMP